MDEKAIKQDCIQLLNTVDVTYLGTIGQDGFPHNRVMANLRNKNQCAAADEVFKDHEDDFLVYMATGHSSPKMQQIRANPKISVYCSNNETIHTLLLVGNTEEIDDPDLKKTLWQDEWKIHWPGGPEDPELVLLKFAPHYAKGWYKEGPFEFTI